MFQQWSYDDDGLGATGVVAAAGGPIGIAIAAGSVLVPLIIGLFSKHKQRVQREDQVSSAWAQTGPQAINDVMTGWRTCLLSGDQAVAALLEIERQFLELTTPIVKTGGKWGVFPSAEGPSPAQCNWACGTRIELHKQIAGLTDEIKSRGGVHPQCETLESRAARKCANPNFVARNPSACASSGKYSPEKVAASSSDPFKRVAASLGLDGEGSILLIAAAVVGGVLLFSDK